VFDDYAAAKRLYPDADTMLVNGAGAAIKDAQYLVAGHRNKATLFVRHRQRAFPNAPPIRVFATKLVNKVGEDPAVTDWLPDAYDAGATSAIKAAKIARFHLGYDVVVLVGCPMTGDGYAAFDAALKGGPLKHDCKRIGDPSAQKTPQIVRYRERLKKYADRGDLKGVYSMSGYTKEILGAP
jgi:hypothetical protein